jgi:hypothetical protein
LNFSSPGTEKAVRQETGPRSEPRPVTKKEPARTPKRETAKDSKKDLKKVPNRDTSPKQAPARKR